MTQHIDCRYCRGSRPTDGKRCLGCGSPVANARVVSRKRKQRPRKCPKCGSGNYEKTHDEGRFECRRCSAYFEDQDFEFVDDRPEVNAMKKERSR